MSEWTHKNGVDGIRRQAQEFIEQAYQRGYKAGQENALSVETDKLIEQGRNEAWEAARKIMSQNDASWSMEDMEKMFGLSYSTDIMLDLSASEVIEKIRTYEKKKQKEAKEIRVGDEVTYTFDNGISIVPFVVLKIRCLEDVGKYYEGLETSDMRWVGGGLDYKKTGRTFPEIAEALKKMQEGE